jgi:hypothetical protein
MTCDEMFKGREQPRGALALVAQPILAVCFASAPHALAQGAVCLGDHPTTPAESAGEWRFCQGRIPACRLSNPLGPGLETGLTRCLSTTAPFLMPTHNRTFSPHPATGFAHRRCGTAAEHGARKEPAGRRRYEGRRGGLGRRSTQCVRRSNRQSPRLEMAASYWKQTTATRSNRQSNAVLTDRCCRAEAAQFGVRRLAAALLHPGLPGCAP